MTDSNPQQTATTVNEVIDTLAVVAGIAVPQFGALVAMATALAHIAPTLYVDVMLMLAKKEPTQADKDEVHAKLKNLLNPESAYADAAPSNVQ